MPLSSPESASRVHERALTYRAQGKYAKALPFALRALHLAERIEEPTHPAIVSFVNTVGEIYQAQGQYAAAASCYRRAVALTDTANGDIDVVERRVQSLRHLANLHRVQGQYEEARRLHRKALRKAEQDIGLDHDEVAACLNDLAVLYKYTGRSRQPNDCIDGHCRSQKRRSGRTTLQ